MANTSIYNAFKRMWHHIQLALSNKIEKNTGNNAWVGVSELHIDDEEGNGAYITPENGDGTLMFYGSGGDQAVRLQNIATPINDREAATKEYVDSNIPTKVSDLRNDSGYIIEDDVGNYILDASEEWTFTLADGSTVTKRVVLG